MTLEILGFVATAIVVIAYIPQIQHLISKHCSAGLSWEAYTLWGVAGILFLLHAIEIHDLVFIVVQTIVIVLDALIFAYALHFQNSACAKHSGK